MTYAEIGLIDTDDGGWRAFVHADFDDVEGVGDTPADALRALADEIDEVTDDD